MKYVICVDVGATKTRIGVGSVNGEILEKVIIHTSMLGENPASTIIDVIRSKFRKYLDHVIGVILNPPNAPFRNVEIVDIMENELSCEVILVNDAVAAVWAEKTFGTGRQFKNIVYLTISTGIGAGVVVDNHLLLGKDGNAHEVGHIVVDYHGILRCGCGGYGHWEAYCSGRNIPRYVKYLIENKYKSYLRNSMLYKDYVEDSITSEKLYHYAKCGDELSYRIVCDDIGKLNAAGIASVINCYDPELLILGGSIVLNNVELVVKPILKYLNMYLTNRPPRIEVTSMGDDVVLKGAIAVVVNKPKQLVEG